MADLRLSQSLVLVETTQFTTPMVQISQVIILVEADQTMLRVSQAMVLFEAEYIAPKEGQKTSYGEPATLPLEASGYSPGSPGSSSGSTPGPSDVSSSGSTDAASGSPSSSGSTPEQSTAQLSGDTSEGSGTPTGGKTSSVSFARPGMDSSFSPGEGAATTSGSTATSAPSSAPTPSGSAASTPAKSTPSRGSSSSLSGISGGRSNRSSGGSSGSRSAGSLSSFGDETMAPMLGESEEDYETLQNPSTHLGLWSLELYDKTGQRVSDQVFTYQLGAFTHNALGGPMQFNFTVLGPYPDLWYLLKYLTYSVLLKSPLGEKVWEGIIEEVNLTLPGLTVGLTVQETYNRVAVTYSRDLSEEAKVEDMITPWAEDAASIALYGTKAYIHDLPESGLEQATTFRDTILSSSKDPLPILQMGEGGEPRAVIGCVGRWLTFQWLYYTNDTGYIKLDADSAHYQPLGYVITKDTIGFNLKGIHDIEMGLSKIPLGFLRITGTTYNNRSVKITGAPADKVENQVTTTSGATFDPNDDIAFGAWESFDLEEMIKVTGSTLNDGFYFLKTVADNRVEVNGGGIETEVVASGVTIIQGHHASIEHQFHREEPGASVSLTSWFMLAQRFESTDSWDAQEIILGIGRQGTPPGNLRVSLYSETSDLPGTELAYVDITPIEVGVSTSQTICKLTTPVTLTATTKYWVVITALGSGDDEGYWKVNVSDEMVSTFRSKIHNGSAWVDNDEIVDVPLQVWATMDSADKITQMAATNSYVKGTQVSGTTGVRVRVYSDGRRTIAEEITEILEIGNSDNEALLAWFDSYGILMVDVRPPTSSDLILRGDGTLVAVPQSEWPLGRVPVRRWVKVENLPPGYIFDKLSPFFVESTTLDPVSKEMTLEPRANLALWKRLE